MPFLPPPEQLLPLLGLTSSSIFDFLYKILLGRFGYPEFVVGVLQKLPMPSLDGTTVGSLGQLALLAWQEKKES